MNTVKHKVNQCPYCDSTNLNYGVIEIDGDSGIYFPIYCQDCGKTSKEFHNLVYSETIGDE